MSPGYPNHWLLAMCMNAGVLLAAMRLAVVKRTLSLDFRAVFDDFVPPMRVMLLLLYFWATFAKLNTGYFTPQTSCAVWELEMILAPFPALASSSVVQWLGIVGSVATEGAIFVLLLVPRYRVAGIVLGGAFHLMLSIKAYHGFISILFAQYFLFTPESFPRRGAPARSRRTRSAPAALAGARPAAPRDRSRGRLCSGRDPDHLRPHALVERHEVRLRRDPAHALLRVGAFALPLLPARAGRAPPRGATDPRRPANSSRVARAAAAARALERRRALPRPQDRGVLRDVQQPAHRGRPLEPLRGPEVAPTRRLGRPRRDRRIPLASRRCHAGARSPLHLLPAAQIRESPDATQRRNHLLSATGRPDTSTGSGTPPRSAQRYPYLVRKLVFFRAPKAPYGSCQH